MEKQRILDDLNRAYIGKNCHGNLLPSVISAGPMDHRTRGSTSASPTGRTLWITWIERRGAG
jgi:hypothetical protein